jgi:hypothetical protein
MRLFLLAAFFPPPKTFQHLIRKKGVIVFVEFRKGLLSLWFAVPAGLLCRMKPIRWQGVLISVAILIERAGF